MGSGHHDAVGDERVHRHAGAALLCMHELRGRQRVMSRVDRPVVVVEVELGVHRDQVAVRLVERVDGADIAPVVAVSCRRPGHVVVPEVVDLCLSLAHEIGDDVAAHVVLARGVQRVLGQCVEQHPGGEHVVAHRGVDVVRRVGQPHGIGRLLPEGGDRAAVLGRLDDPELVRELQRLADRGHGHAGTGVHVLGHHLAGVHPVDVVGPEDDHVAGPLVLDEVQALVDRVRRAGEPPRAEPLLRRHRRDVVAEHRRETPRLGDVAVEAVALVLRQHDDLAIAAVDQVGQDEVDQAVDPAERDRRLGPVGGQWHQSLALTAGEHDGENLLRHGETLSRFGGSSRGLVRGAIMTGCASTSSPASTRRRSTAAPGCTSSTSPESCAAWSTSRCTAWEPRGTSQASRRTACRRRCPTPTRRCALSGPTCRWSPAARAPTWCTRTPGTRTRPATWPSCCTACRT